MIMSDKTKLFVNNIDSIINENDLNVVIKHGICLDYRINDIVDLYIDGECPNCDKIDYGNPEVAICETSIYNVIHIRFCDISLSILPNNIDPEYLKREVVKQTLSFVDTQIVTLIYYYL